MNTLYIVIDMQKDFVTGPLGTQEARNIVPKIKEKLEAVIKESDVVFTMDTHFKDYAQTLEGYMLPIPHCIEYTDGWQVVDELDEYNKIMPFRKHTFGSMELADYVTQRAYDKIVLMGVCTDICVVSNALLLRAALPNTPIYVYKDCCAGTTPDAHEAALKVMKSCQIVVE